MRSPSCIVFCCLIRFSFSEGGTRDPWCFDSDSRKEGQVARQGCGDQCWGTAGPACEFQKFKVPNPGTSHALGPRLVIYRKLVNTYQGPAERTSSGDEVACSLDRPLNAAERIPLDLSQQSSCVLQVSTQTGTNSMHRSASTGMRRISCLDLNGE